MSVIGDNEAFRNAIPEIDRTGIIKAQNFQGGLEFDNVEYGKCVYIGPSSKGEDVGIFESENRDSPFLYSMKDAVFYNRMHFPVGATFSLDGSTIGLLVVVAKQQGSNRYLCMRITDIEPDDNVFFFISKTEISDLISLCTGNRKRHKNLFDWIKSHNPEYAWDFSDPDGTRKNLVEIIRESGGLDLKGLIYLLNECYDNVPLYGEDFIKSNDPDTVFKDFYDKWISWSEDKND